MPCGAAAFRAGTEDAQRSRAVAGASGEPAAVGVNDCVGAAVGLAGETADGRVPSTGCCAARPVIDAGGWGAPLTCAGSVTDAEEADVGVPTVGELLTVVGVLTVGGVPTGAAGTLWGAAGLRAVAGAEAGASDGADCAAAGAAAGDEADAADESDTRWVDAGVCWTAAETVPPGGPAGGAAAGAAVLAAEGDVPAVGAGVRWTTDVRGTTEPPTPGGPAGDRGAAGGAVGPGSADCEGGTGGTGGTGGAGDAGGGTWARPVCWRPVIGGVPAVEALAAIAPSDAGAAAPGATGNRWIRIGRMSLADAVAPGSAPWRHANRRIGVRRRSDRGVPGPGRASMASGRRRTCQAVIDPECWVDVLAFRRTLPDACVVPGSPVPAELPGSRPGE
jgi:hypothetical protein